MTLAEPFLGFFPWSGVTRRVFLALFQLLKSHDFPKNPLPEDEWEFLAFPVLCPVGMPKTLPKIPLKRTFLGILCRREQVAACNEIQVWDFIGITSSLFPLLWDEQLQSLGTLWNRKFSNWENSLWDQAEAEAVPHGSAHKSSRKIPKY